jgi:type I restriction enzyme S subunit
VLRITGCANDGVAAFLDLSTDVDPLYLYYRLLSMTTYLRRVVAAGGDQPNLNTESIGRLLLPLPPRSQQGAVVEQLASVDRTVRSALARTAQAKTLLRQATETFLLRRPT